MSRSTLPWLRGFNDDNMAASGAGKSSTTLETDLECHRSRVAINHGRLDFAPCLLIHDQDTRTEKFE
jgi:hypothetical protein